MPKLQGKSPAPGRGRGHTALTPDVHARIVAFVRAGSYDYIAAAAAGVSKGTFSKWLKRGAEQIRLNRRGIYRSLLEDIEKAAAEAEIRDIARIDKAAAAGIWQAAAWRLERKHPDRWGRREHTTVAAAQGSQPQGSQPVVPVVVLPVEDTTDLGSGAAPERPGQDR